MTAQCNMWNTYQRQGLMPFKPPQQQRNLGMYASPYALSWAIAPNKSFKNPNFVNTDSTRGPVDSYSSKSFTNSCSSPIIDSIIKKCPEVIPYTESEEISSMCHNNRRKKSAKMGHKQSRKQSGKNSRQILTKQEINDMVEDEEVHEKSDALADIASSPHMHSLNLRDFIEQKPTLSPKTPSIPIQTTSLGKPTGILIMFTPPQASPKRMQNISTSESEDSFIIFNYDDNQESNDPTKEESPNHRVRIPSVCESEDSFIIFDHDSDDSDIEDDDSSEEESWEEISDAESELDDNINSLYSTLYKEEPVPSEEPSKAKKTDFKKVSFAPESDLCEVHPMIKWSYAYQAARKGPWERYARDRCRFKDRALRVENQIKHILEPQHREKIYRERFDKI